MNTPLIHRPWYISATLAVSALSCAVGLHAQQPRVFTSQFTFGDSLSDNGNLFALTAGTQPPAPYYNGRFSNGPVFPEYLRSGLQPAATAAASVRTNLDFAFGGATAAPGSPVPTLAQQIGMMQQRGITPAASDLFTVLAGANDLLNTISNPATQNPAAVTATGRTAAASVTGAVQTLLSLGAKNILVLNIPDISRTARFTTGSGAPAASLASDGVQAFNTDLRSQLGALTVAADARLTLFDLGSYFNSLLTNASLFGFTNTRQEYLGLLAAGQNPGDVGGYIFWDGIHPTTKTHAILAQALTEALNPEPVLASAAPQGTTLLALVDTAATVLDRHLDARGQTRPSEVAAWIDYSHKESGRDARTGAQSWEPDYDYNLDAVSIGIDCPFAQVFSGGLVLSADSLDSHSAGIGRFEARGQTLTGFLSWQDNSWFADATVSYGSHGLRDIRRITAFGGMETNARSDSDNRGVSIRFGRYFGGNGKVQIMPWVGFRHATVDVDGYTETGVPGLDFTYGGSQSRSTDGLVGVRVDWLLRSSGHRFLKFGLDASARQDLGSDNRALRGVLANTVATPVTLTVADGNQRSLDLGVRATGNLGKRWAWTGVYSFESLTGGRSGHLYSLSVQTGF